MKTHRKIITGSQCLGCIEQGLLKRDLPDDRGWRMCLEQCHPPQKVVFTKGTNGKLFDVIEQDWQEKPGDWTPDKSQCLGHKSS